MFQWYQNLTATKKIIILTVIDLFLSWFLPAIVIATEYKLFELTDAVPPQTRATAITYILLIGLVAAILWRVKEIVTLTRSNGLKYALTKGATPFLFIIFYFVLGAAGENIDKLRTIFLWSALFHFVALYFRFRIGVLTKEIANADLVKQIKKAVK